MFGSNAASGSGSSGHAGGIGGVCYVGCLVNQTIASGITTPLVLGDVAISTPGASSAGGDTITLSQPGLYLAMGFVVAIPPGGVVGSVKGFIGGTGSQTSYTTILPGALASAGNLLVHDICYVASTPTTVQLIITNALSADADFSGVLFVVYLGSGTLTW